MAEVWLARQRGPMGFEKLVAIKRLLSHLSEQELFVRMFLDEARIAARISHSNVVQIFDLGEAAGTYYIAMEYLLGETLARVSVEGLRRSHPLPELLGAAVVAQACKGLHYAHSLRDARGALLGVVHRDVSPQNVIIQYDGTVKLVDFGIAKARERLSETTVTGMKGKFAYMSPEQCTAEAVDHRSDIFSVGVVLWELLTGRRLFKHPNRQVMLRMICEARVPAPSRVNRQVPRELDHVALCALARRPEDRYQSADELAAELEAILSALGVTSAQAQLARHMREVFAEDLAERHRAATFDSSETPVVTLQERTASAPSVSRSPTPPSFNVTGPHRPLSLRRLRKAAKKADADAGTFYALGRAELDEGNQEEGVAALLCALDCMPSAELSIAIGTALQELDRNHEAAQAFQQAVQLDPDSVDAIGLLGLALTQEPGHVQRGLEYLREAAGLSPESPEAQHVLALRLLEAGEQKEAMLRLRAAINAHPDFQPALVLLGRCRWEEGEVTEAIALLRAAVHLDPADVQAKVELGIALAKGGDRVGAVQLFEEVVDEEAAPEMLVNVGLAFRELGDNATALRYVRDAVRLDPDLVEAQANLGILLMEEGLPGAATVTLSRAVELAPDWYLAHYNLGLAYERHGDLERAEAALADALRLNPDDDEIKQRVKTVRAARRGWRREDAEKSARAAAMVGSLEQFPLPDLLQLLSTARRSGVLYLSSEGRQGEVTLLDGAIVAASSSAARLGELLAAEGVSNASLEDAARRQREGAAQELGELLLGAGLIDRERLDRAITAQVKCAVGEMLGFTQGRFAFEPNRQAIEERPGLLRLGVNSVLLDVLREQELAARPEESRGSEVERIDDRS